MNQESNVILIQHLVVGGYVPGSGRPIPIKAMSILLAMSSTLGVRIAMASYPFAQYETN